MRNLLFTVFILPFVFGCSSHRAQFKGNAFEKHTSLTKTGFTQEKLDSLNNFIKQKLTTTSMVVLKDGKVLFEYGDVTEISFIASCRKSILSMLYGKYVENGTIDLNETIGEVGIDEDMGLTALEKTATVHDIINSRSGVFLEPVNGGYDKENILKRGSVKPGEYFVYNNWDYNVAGSIFEIKTGKNIYKAMEEQLAIPLGFQNWNIKNQKKKYKRSKSRHPAYHMYLSVLDMAKIGQLMLNRGKWNGKQLISEKWIDQMLTVVTPVETVNKRYKRNKKSAFQFAYGNMWWLVDNIKQHPDFKGAYHASGWGGQFITVIPKLNMVIAHKHKVPKLVLWGLKRGNDVPGWQYWQLLYDFLRTDASNTITKQEKK